MPDNTPQIVQRLWNYCDVPHEGGTASAPAPSGNGARRPGEQIELGL